MSRPTSRLHRLPKRTDYILIPAPLDLSLPIVSEKSPLPAIIVTPSSPSSSRDFSIAFLADPPKPSLRERLFNKNANLMTDTILPSLTSMRVRSMMLIFVVIFVLVCHLVTHRLAIRRPYLELELTASTQSGDAHSFVSEVPLGWFDVRDSHTATGAEDTAGGTAPAPEPRFDGGGDVEV